MIRGFRNENDKPKSQEDAHSQKKPQGAQSAMAASIMAVFIIVCEEKFPTLHQIHNDFSEKKVPVQGVENTAVPACAVATKND